MIDTRMAFNPFLELQKSKRDKFLTGGGYGSDRPPCPFADIPIFRLYDVCPSQHHLKKQFMPKKLGLVREAVGIHIYLETHDRIV